MRKYKLTGQVAMHIGQDAYLRDVGRLALLLVEGINLLPKSVWLGGQGDDSSMEERADIEEALCCLREIADEIYIGLTGNKVTGRQRI